MLPLSPPHHVTRSWIDTKINRVSLPEALRCWEFETMAHRHPRQLPVTQNALQQQSVADKLDPEPVVSIADVRAEARISEQVPIISPSPSITSQIVPVPVPITDSQSVAPRQGNRTRGSEAGATQEGMRKRKRKRKHRQRHHHMKNRRLRAERNHHHHHTGRHENKICRHRLMDHCSWPQCNRACPRLYNPLTGKLQQPMPPLPFP